MMGASLGFVFCTGNESARETGEGSSISLGNPPPALGQQEYNLSKEGSTNE